MSGIAFLMTMSEAKHAMSQQYGATMCLLMHPTLGTVALAYTWWHWVARVEPFHVSWAPSPEPIPKPFQCDRIFYIWQAPRDRVIEPDEKCPVLCVDAARLGIDPRLGQIYWIDRVPDGVPETASACIRQQDAVAVLRQPRWHDVSAMLQQAAAALQRHSP